MGTRRGWDYTRKQTSEHGHLVRISTVLRLGVVSFLNARPLIDGLEEDPEACCLFDVPAALSDRLERGEVDAALIPIVDVLRAAGRYAVVSNACIGCDGETMTVRVFSQVPPDRIHDVWVDTDSHTSVALLRVLWRELYDRDLTLHSFDARQPHADKPESVLLIGDKVVDPGRGRFAYEIDLGGAWRQHTGLPFVFAVWATPATGPRAARDALDKLLRAARDRGVARASEIAAEDGPGLGWPVELAERYLARCLRFQLDERAIAGAELFARHCATAGIISADARVSWPEDLLEQHCV